MRKRSAKAATLVVVPSLLLAGYLAAGQPGDDGAVLAMDVSSVAGDFYHMTTVDHARDESGDAQDVALAQGTAHLELQPLASKEVELCGEELR